MRFGVFIYDGGEPIDLATYGVLSMARRIAPTIELCTIAPEAGIVRLSSGLRVVADYGIQSAPECDVLIVTGGPGWETQANNAQTLSKHMTATVPGCASLIIRRWHRPRAHPDVEICRLLIFEESSGPDA